MLKNILISIMFISILGLTACASVPFDHEDHVHKFGTKWLQKNRSCLAQNGILITKIHSIKNPELYPTIVLETKSGKLWNLALDEDHGKRLRKNGYTQIGTTSRRKTTENTTYSISSLTDEYGSSIRYSLTDYRDRFHSSARYTEGASRCMIGFFNRCDSKNENCEKDGVKYKFIYDKKDRVIRREF